MAALIMAGTVELPGAAVSAFTIGRRPGLTVGISDSKFGEIYNGPLASALASS
jgi:hypothetical protein